MFENNNEAVKVWSNGKLASVKVKKLPNRKKKRNTDPDFVVMAVVDVATFDKNTNKQIGCVSSYMDMNDLYVFMEALSMYGRKALHIDVTKGKKMPAVEIFASNGGTTRNGEIIARKLSVTTGGPDKNADFFIVADEAPGHIEGKLYVKNQGAKSINWISKALSAKDVLAIANGCKSAVDILNTWSAMGTLWKNLDRIDPKRNKEDDTNGGDYERINASLRQEQRPPERSYAAQGNRVPQSNGYGNNQGYGNRSGYVANSSPQRRQNQPHYQQSGYSQW